MTKAHSELNDNDGRCEFCDDPSTVGQPQRAYPVKLGGGFGQGTMWLCRKCLIEHETRDSNAAQKVDSGIGAVAAAPLSQGPAPRYRVCAEERQVEQPDWFTVMVTPTEGMSPSLIGPFPSPAWASRYVERVGRLYHKLEIKRLHSPRLLDPSRPGDDCVVFDPEKNIDC